MSINLDQANCVIHNLASLKYEQNKNRKLCYSDTDICLDWSSGTARAVSSILSKASAYLPEWALPKGWNRDLESLNPIIDKVTICMLQTIQAPTEIVVTIGKIRDAQDGLKSLAQNQYAAQADKMALVQQAIHTLGETVMFMNGKLKAADSISREFAALLEQNGSKDRRIQELEARVAELETYILESDDAEVVSSLGDLIDKAQTAARQERAFLEGISARLDALKIDGVGDAVPMQVSVE